MTHLHLSPSSPISVNSLQHFTPLHDLEIRLHPIFSRLLPYPVGNSFKKTLGVKKRMFFFFPPPPPPPPSYTLFSDGDTSRGIFQRDAGPHSGFSSPSIFYLRLVDTFLRFWNFFSFPLLFFFFSKLQSLKDLERDAYSTIFWFFSFTNVSWGLEQNEKKKKRTD